MAIRTIILDEFRTPTTVAILEQQKPNGENWGGFIVKSYRKFPDERTARAVYEEAKKIKRSRTREGNK